MYVVKLHAPAALPPEKVTRYPSGMRLGGPQSRCGRIRKKNLATYRDSNSDPLDRPADRHVQSIVETPWRLKCPLRLKVRTGSIRTSCV
jgi:hypothetical protein